MVCLVVREGKEISDRSDHRDHKVDEVLKERKEMSGSLVWLEVLGKKVLPENPVFKVPLVPEVFPVNRVSLDHWVQQVQWALLVQQVLPGHPVFQVLEVRPGSLVTLVYQV